LTARYRITVLADASRFVSGATAGGMLLRAGRRVRVQVAQGVLQSGQPVLQHGRVPVRLVPMPKRAVEDAALPVLVDPAQGEVVVGPVLPVLLRRVLQHPLDALGLR